MNKNRNRHTGKVNAFKKDILKKGIRTPVGNTEYACIPVTSYSHGLREHMGTMVRAGSLT